MLKKMLLIGMALLLAVPAFATIRNLGPGYDQVVKLFQSEQEPEAMDAIWDSAELLKIGVFDHGKQYAGYAQHVCEVVEKNGFSGKAVSVQIIDLSQLITKEKWVVLGQASCH